MNPNFKRYLIFWLSQALSQLGSSMTGFALILWAYAREGSAMTVSLMTFFHYIPYILASLFAGNIVDHHSKKKIMLISDSAAAVCSAGILCLYMGNALQIWNIYMANGIIGFLSAFQEPAAAVAVGKLVPREKWTQVSGMQSFSTNLVMVLSPVLAASVYVLGGLRLILILDLGSFLFAFLVLFFVVTIPEELLREGTKRTRLAGCGEGVRYLMRNRGIFSVILTMALLNFFSRLTYENILSPMILSRSANDSVALGVVNAVMGIGGIVGGILVSTGKGKTGGAKSIYLSAMLSFLLGDVMMGLGRNVWVWSFAGLAASLPIPFINAGQTVIFYRNVPETMQGRIFAVRNAIQFSSIPVGVLLGGYLADYVFEPFMRTDGPAAGFLQMLVGTGTGSGMAVMFLCTGVLGSAFSFAFYRRKDVRSL